MHPQASNFENDNIHDYILCCILLEIFLTDHYSLSQNCIIIHMKYMYLSYDKELSFSNHDQGLSNFWIEFLDFPDF